MEMIIAADNAVLPGAMGSRDACGEWAGKVFFKIGTLAVLKVKPVGWDYYIGVWGTDNWLGHAALQVTLPDGTIFYLDNWWWGGYFAPSDVPHNVTPINPLSPPDHRLLDLLSTQLNMIRWESNPFRF